MMVKINHEFDTESDPLGHSWQLLAASTAKQKAAGGFSANILIRSGRFRASIHSKATNKSVEVGTNILSKNKFLYPAAHQFGTKRVPQREWLGVNDDEKAIQKIFIRYLRSM